METVTMSSKGQLVIPKGLRLSANLQPGDQLAELGLIDRHGVFAEPQLQLLGSGLGLLGQVSVHLLPKAIEKLLVKTELVQVQL